MKHLLNFDTVAEYDAVKDSLEQPYVVTIDENNGLQYNTDVIRLPKESCGGGSASGNEVFNCEYLDISEVSNKMGWNSVAILAKVSSQGMTFIAPPSYNPFGLTGLVAVAVDFNFSIVAESGGQKMEVSIREVLNQNGVSNEDINTIPRITKEEFYTF